MFLLPVQMVGCSHETSAADVVGRLRMPAIMVDACLAQLRAQGVPAVLLSTCHRTELYWWGEDDLSPWFEAQVVSRGGGAVELERREADLAVRHLFSVTAGMRSARFGEPEIMRQVRTAWMAAQLAGTTSTLLDTVFRRALEAARHIRVAIGSDADPSLGARVRDALQARFADAGSATSQPREVLIVGAGDAARGVVETLVQPALRAGMRVAITSRSDTSAARLAATAGAIVVPWADRDEAIRSADAVVFAVQASTPLIDGSLAQTLVDGCASRAFWIDLGVPANVDATALPAQVDCVGIDLLAPQSRRDLARDRRANGALQRELARFAGDMQRRRIGARITVLEARAATVARAALAASTSPSGSDDSADAVARQVTRLLLREIAELSA
ncbi:MAG: NAD(P)-binding domain-containing protein [Gemmatimonadota bacterium]